MIAGFINPSLRFHWNAFAVFFWGSLCDFLVGRSVDLWCLSLLIATSILFLAMKIPHTLISGTRSIYQLYERKHGGRVFISFSVMSLSETSGWVPLHLYPRIVQFLKLLFRNRQRLFPLSLLPLQLRLVFSKRWQKPRHSRRSFPQSETFSTHSDGVRCSTLFRCLRTLLGHVIFSTVVNQKLRDFFLPKR